MPTGARGASRLVRSPLRRRLLGAAPAAAALASLPGRALALPISEIFASARRSVVAVGSSNPLRNPQFSYAGTGYVVGDGLHVATCAHVLAAMDAGRRDPVAVLLPVPGADSANVFLADEVERDTETDSALLRLRSAAPLPALDTNGSDAPPEGTEIAVIGYPLGTTFGLYTTVHRGILSAVVPNLLPKPNATGLSAAAVQAARARSIRLFQLDLTSLPGSSGSPVIDVESGKVIAMVSMSVARGDRDKLAGTATGISFAIPVRHVRALLPRR